MSFAETPVTKVTIPGNVETINEAAFYNCTHLTQLTIDEGVLTIGGNAFSSCVRLARVVIPNTVRTIGYRSFEKCAELEELTLGSNIRSLGAFAFYDCNELKSITSCNETAPEMGNESCFTVYGKAKLYIPIGATASYQSTNYWHKFTEIIEKDLGHNDGPLDGDVNHDNEVTIADVNYIIDIILSK